MTTTASGCSPTGTFKAVLTVVQPSPRPPYCPSKVSEELTLTVTGTFLSHGREPGTITSSGRCGTPFLREDRREKTIATQGREHDELSTLWE